MSGVLWPRPDASLPERVLGGLLTYVHPASWRRNLRRRVDELIVASLADQRTAAEGSAAKTADNVAALLERERLLVQASAMLCGSGHRFSPSQVASLLRALPTTAAGELDEDAFAAAAFEEAAVYADAFGPRPGAVGGEER